MAHPINGIYNGPIIPSTGSNSATASPTSANAATSVGVVTAAKMAPLNSGADAATSGKLDASGGEEEEDSTTENGMFTFSFMLSLTATFASFAAFYYDIAVLFSIVIICVCVCVCPMSPFCEFFVFTFLLLRFLFSYRYSWCEYEILLSFSTAAATSALLHIVSTLYRCF